MGIHGQNNVLAMLHCKHNVTRKVINTFFPFMADAFCGRKRAKEYWASRGRDSERGINNYIELSPTSYPLLEEIKKRTEGNKDVKILDLCCNCGRHLNALHKLGFLNLHGVDVNTACREVQKEQFPDIADVVHCEWMPVEEYLPAVKCNSFDIVFSHGKTIEHIHPRFNLAYHVCRITKKYIILANVGFSAGKYPRFWMHLFHKYGFVPVKLLQPEKEWAPDSQVNRPHSLIVLQRAVR